jgi:hypothetical protein
MASKIFFGVETPILGRIVHTNRISDAHFGRLMAAYTELFTVRERPAPQRGPVVAPTPPTQQEVIEKLSQRIMALIKRDVGEFERRVAAAQAIRDIPPIDTVVE